MPERLLRGPPVLKIISILITIIVACGVWSILGRMPSSSQEWQRHNESTQIERERVQIERAIFTLRCVDTGRTSEQCEKFLADHYRR